MKSRTILNHRWLQAIIGLLVLLGSLGPLRNPEIWATPLSGANFQIPSSSAESSHVSHSAGFSLTGTLGESSSGTAISSSSLTLFSGFRLGNRDPGTLQFSSGTYTVSENGGETTITVTRTDGSTHAVSISYATSNATALAEEDYTHTSGTLTWAEGETASKTFTVTILNDRIDETNETVTLTLSNATTATLGSQSTAILTIGDDDVAGVTVGTISGNTSEDGAAATFTVVLDTKPTSDVMINVSSMDSTEGTASPNSLSFTSTNWNVAQTVTVRGIDDLLFDSNTAYTIALAASSTDNNYSGIEVSGVTVVNEDNDFAGFVISEAQGTLKEDPETPTAASFTIRLKTPPTADVTIDLRITDTTEGSYSDTQIEEIKSLTFTQDNWQVDRTITVFSVDDENNDGDQAFQVVFENLISTDSNYTEAGNEAIVLSELTRTFSTIDNDTSGLVISAVSGKTSEDGKQTANVSVSLKFQPTINVTITVASTDIGEVTVHPTTLTFTPENWAALQTVQLIGVNDNDVDGSQTVGITFEADANYDNVRATASVTNDDDDTAALIVGKASGNTKEDGTSANFTVRLATQPAAEETVIVAISSSDETEGKADRAELKFTHDNWNSDQTLLVFGVDDGDRDGKVGYTIVLNTQSSTGSGGYQGLAKEVSLINEDDEVVGVVFSEISGAVDENGRTATFTVRLQQLPTAEVTLHLVSSDTEEGTVSPASLTFTTDNWRAAQTVTVTGVRGGVSVVDGDQTFVIKSTVTSTDSDYASLVPANVTVLNLDVDKAGVRQSVVSGEPTEGGDTAEFTLSLLSAPQGNVVIDVSSSNEAEGKATPASLTFTTNNWASPQKIVAQGQDEALGMDSIDGPQQFFVNLTVNQALTEDTNYDSLTIPRVSLFNQDNDSAAFIVSEMTGHLQENGVTPQSFTVKLSSQPANSSTVTVVLKSSDTTEGRVETNQLTFTAEDWSSEHKVNVFSVDDNTADGDQSFFIHFERAQSNDNNYSITPASVAVVNEDDDKARFVISALEGTVREDGSSASYKVRLGNQPTGNVVVALAVESGSSNEVTISKSSLTFTDKNWNADQTVVITGLPDETLDGDQSFAIHMTVDSTQTTDSNYASLTIADMTGTNEDMDFAGLVFSENNRNTSEDGTQTSFTLRLRSKPAGNVIVNLSVTDTEEAQLQTPSITFNDKNWSADQTIAVIGVDDDRQDNDQKFYVELTVADSSEDSLYRNLPVARVPFINEDNDVSNFVVTPINQNTREDGTAAEFKVRLSTIPEGDVTLSFQVEGSSSSTPTLSDEVSLSTPSLTFTPENWKADQRVVLRGVDDEDTDGDQTYLITFNAAQSPSDANYQGKQLDLLQGVNEDDDIAEFVVEPLNQTISEDGTESFFRLQLRSRPAEGSTVTVQFQVTGDDTALPTLSVSELEFNRDNWKSWQKVIVTGQDDTVIDGDQPFKIVFSPVVSADPNYTGFVIPTQEGVTNDNDSGGIVVGPISGNVNEQRQRANFKLKLRSQPTSDVTVNMSIEVEKDTQGNVVTGEGEIIPGDETVVFTSQNWNAEQTVRVSGLNDDFQDGDQRFRILFDSIVSTDPHYHGLKLDPITVINEDDDISGFVISEITRPVREDGTTATFTISLRSRPQDQNQGGKTVTVGLSSSDTTEGTVEPSSITFSSDDWRAVHQVRVTGIDDTEGTAVLDGDQSFRIDFTTAQSEDADYHGQIPDSVSVTNIDEDVPEFIVSQTSGETSEDGDRVSFTVRLRTQPEANTTITLPIESSNVEEATVSPTQLMFTADNYSSPQTVTVVGVDDATPVQDGDQPYTIRLKPATAEGSVYHGVDPDDLEFSNQDNESAGFVISEISGNVSEDGLEEYISVRLRTQPTADVVIPVRSSHPTEGKAKVTRLTFNATNWSADQIIGVVGQDEGNLDAQVADGNQPFRILLAPEVDPENANCATDPNLTECQLTVISDDPNYSGLVAGEVNGVNLDNDYEGIVVGNLSGNVTEDGTQQTFFVRLRSNPQETVVLDVSTSHIDEVTVSPATLTFNADNWRGQQVVTVTGVNDNLSDGDQLATIKVDVASSSSAYQGVLGEEIEVLNEDNDIADILVSVMDANTNEDGSTATFAVRLQSQPANDQNVTIHLTSSDPTEGTVTPTSLVFTANNWEALQTVRVAGVEDTDSDGNVRYQIELAVDAASDESYLGMTPNPVVLVNSDNEKPGFIITEPTNDTREDGTQTSFLVRLSSPPATDSTVTVNLQSSNTSEGQVFPAILSFNETNWNANQTIIVIGQDDESASPQDDLLARLWNRLFRADTPSTGIKDGDQSYQVIFGETESTDPNYSGLIPDRVRLVNEDDDTAGYILSGATGTIDENGSQGQFQVELRTQPLDSITIRLTSNDTTEGLVSPSQLVFTPDNWNAAQTVTVTGVNDDLLDGNRSFEITLAIDNAGSDTEYAALADKMVSVTNEDNDAAGLVVSEVNGQASENGATATFTVNLQSQPTATVQVDLNSSALTELTLSPTVLQFDASNWNIPQTVTLTGQDESIKDGNQTVRITFDTQASADGNYAALSVPFLEATNEDNDIADFLASALSLSQLHEADLTNTSSFALKLKTQPTNNVTVNLSANKGKTDEVLLTPTSLVFTTDNWNTNQSVNVTAQNDTLADGDQVVRIVGTSISDDENYNNRVAVNQALVNLDDDTPGVKITPSIVSVKENDSNTFQVQLSTEPTHSVVLTFVSSNTNLGTIDTTPADTSTVTHTLTFSPTDWATSQAVQVSVGSIVGDDSTFQVTTTSASDDTNYANLMTENIVVSVQNQASLVVTKNALTVNENASTASFAIQLGALPIANVTLTLSTDGTEAALSPETLTFTPNNWDTLQEVIVTGVDDLIEDGTIASPIQMVLESDDVTYQNLENLPSVTIQTEDNDTTGFSVNGETEITLKEADTHSATFTVRLTSEPLADVTIRFSSSDSEEVQVIEQLVFTSSNWQTDQTVSVTTEDDVVDDGNRTVSITTTITSDDTAYATHPFPSISVVTLDDDQQVNASDGGATVNSDTFTSSLIDLSLSWDPKVAVSDQNTVASDIIREYTPAEGSSSDVSKTTTIMHKATVGDKKAGLEGIVEPQLVDGQKSTVYLEGSASGFVSDSAAFVGTKTTDEAVVQASINFAGGIEIAVTPTDNTGALLLPEMALGTQVVISDTQIVAEMTLPDHTEGAPRMVGAIDPTRWYYMGRDLENQTVVYLRGKANAKIQIIRELNQNTTTIRIESGSVEVKIGNADPIELLAGEELLVQNRAYTFPIHAGSNLISAGVYSSVSAAEWEVKLRTVHSIWRWNYVAPDWQVYSPQVAVNQKLTEDLRISPFTTDIQPTDGLWIYSEVDTHYLMHDKEYGELKPDLSLGGWYLLGNNSGQPINIGEFFEQNAKIQSLWLVREDRWKAYATDSQIDALIVEESDVDQLSAEDVIPPGHAIWINTETGITITRDKLRRPPGGND